ncbi:MAG: 50S ribosomal protein L9 [Myxococcota bacterium]|jgi:large subunit ribosomal protein L9|nr:50S ribosomal protein L9 [Myxococcota bacterium]
MGAVKVILREEVPKLGTAGDLVSVKPGYARNFLVPRGMATIATESGIKELEHHQRVIAEKLAKELKDLRATSHKLKAMTLEARRRAGEDGKLFGSVTSQNIAELIEEQGVKIDRRKIQLADAIKEIGEHTIAIKLHSEIESSVKLVVSAEEE